jgi:hypothetical protein
VHASKKRSHSGASAPAAMHHAWGRLFVVLAGTDARTHGRGGWAPEPVHGFAVGCPHWEEQTNSGFLWSSGLYRPFRVLGVVRCFGQYWCWTTDWQADERAEGRQEASRRHARALDKGQGEAVSHHGRPCPC